MRESIASLSIAARVTLDLHDLNNEGGEGNQIQTREVDIVGADGRMHNVNAVSGDMLKHIQTEHFYKLARASDLPLCAGCALFDANRVNADREWLEHMPARDREALSALLRYCAIDDTAGTLITASGAAGRRALRRNSVVEFGWTTGLPAAVLSPSHLHVKYVGELAKEQVIADAVAREQEGSNLGQVIYHRPAASGIYAMVCHLELGRIGYNDITQTYAIDEPERLRRARVTLQSVWHTFLELNGAMRATQLPHLVALQGIITWSQDSAVPAPLISPLAGGWEDTEGYREQAQVVTNALNEGQESVVTCRCFESIGDFAVQMRYLVDEAVPRR